MPTTNTNHTPLSDPMQTAMLFAARYAHYRQTGAALAVVSALISCWHQLTPHTRDQIIRESIDAVYNQDDWQRLRAFSTRYDSSIKSPPSLK